MNLDELKEALLTHICNQGRAFISQQIGDPELKFDEKFKILENLLDDSHLKFLRRYGSHLRKDHLKYFESADNDICECLKFIEHEMDHQNVKVKNRRYAAMLKMLQKDEYFSLIEMRSREPLLYEQYVGQYETPEEKRAHLRPNSETDTLVEVLLKSIDNRHADEQEEQQRKEEERLRSDINDEDDDSTRESSSEYCRPPQQQQWGNLEDENNASNSKNSSNSRKRHAEFVTADEKNLLRREFSSIMYQNFLSGNDKDHFDYTQVDENSEYDNLSEIDQDEEDKYFEDEKNDEDEMEDFLDQHPINNDDDEDELDIYMKHLKQNMKRQQNNVFEEEFDD